MSLPTPFVRPEATTWSVEDILRRAREGQLYIPAFQRAFRWEANDVRKLFDSIYRGYPIGNLLLWETDQTEGSTTSFGPVRFSPAKGRGFIIIDGQQRITSLLAVLLGDGSKEPKYRLSFDLEKATFVHGKARESLVETLLPLSEVADTVRFLEWLQSRRLPSNHVATANNLVRSLRDYRVPVYIVHTQEEDQVRGIFERMNTTGRPLKAEEIFAALQRGRHGTDLGALAASLEELKFGTIEEDWLLKSVAALLGIDVTRNLGEALRNIPSDKIRRGVSDAERAIRGAIRFLQQDAGIMHIELLPYRVPLVLLTKFFHLVPEPSSDTRRRLASWVWRGAWSQQHGRSDAPTIRSALERVTRNEKATVEHLLAITPQPNEPFRLGRHDFRYAGTKLTCTALASLKPRNLVTGAEFSLASLLGDLGAQAFHRIVKKGGANTRGTENRLMHESLKYPMRDAIVSADEKALISHCIPYEARRALGENKESLFLAARHEALQELVRDFLAARTTVEGSNLGLFTRR